ncbi:TetR/AcrR family transcriptional regulator [Mycolicibacterium mucogenicum]|uniref:TetR/AcrR family transcriptional regulator n=1 Tax=Mycolicibacterium mucogenicum TaxID=56689 RepID=UPI00076ACCD9|nr:TetR/AcrR family transcriptional regulator [Mycolicibacterium mucogenicum]SHV07300.1 transcriptional regulator [Mycobacteroides abscessus subsp. abscessus]
MSAPQRRPRGRPVGGGNNTEQARQVLLDAAEQFFIDGGSGTFTMEVIAAEAGYSRSAIYRQFATRKELIAALVQRTTQRHMLAMLQQVAADATPVDLLIDSLVIVATQLVHDPLLQTIAAQTPDGAVATLIANDGSLTRTVQSMVEGMLANGTAGQFRPGLHPHDLAQFLISTALSLLLDVVPGSSDPTVARNYLETFVLPAIVDSPPPATRVFPE